MGIQKREGVHLVITVVLLSGMVYAQQTTKHPIDKMLEACLDKNSTTAGMVDCISKADDRWDKELNRVYAELMKRLSPDARAKLKEAQVQWLKFRDSEFQLQGEIFSKLEGTMYIPMSADSQMQVVKKRALDLKAYLDLSKAAQ